MKFKKLVCVSLILSMAVTALSSCGETTEESSGSSTGGSETASGNGETAELEEWQKFTKYDPPITLTTDRWQSPDATMEWDEDPYRIWCKETLGIIWEPKFTATTHEDHLEKVQMLAASNDLPDVLADVGGTILQDYYSKGFIRDLEEDFEKWGSPLSNYVLFEEFRAVCGDNAYAGYENENGKSFVVPLVLDPLNALAGEKLFYRKDILDEMGYDEPTNLAELTEVMEAYVAQYNKPAYLTENWFFGTMAYVYTLHGAQPMMFYEKDGEIVYGGIEPGAKDALATLRDWYKKGIIASNYDTIDYGQEQASIAQGNYFVMSGQVWFPGWMQPQLNENIANGELAPLPFIEGSNGEVNPFILSQPMGWPTGITTNCEYPEAVIWEVNECFESFLRNDEDLREMFDFKYPITTPQEPMNPEVVTDPEKGVGYALFNYAEDEIGPGFLNQGKSLSPGINYGDRRAVSYQNNVAAVKAAYEANGYDNDKTLAALEGSAKSFFLDNYVNHGEVKGNSIATKNSLLNYEYISQAINDGVIQFDGGLGPWGLPLQEVTDYWGTLEAMEREYTHKIIKGEIPLDDFDKFVTEWKANGGDEILRAKNELYQQMTGN